MQKETVDALAQLAVRELVKTNGVEGVDHLALGEWLGSELPGLEIDQIDLIIDRSDEYLKIVEVHVDIPFWRLDESEELRAKVSGNFTALDC